MRPTCISYLLLEGVSQWFDRFLIFKVPHQWNAWQSLICHFMIYLPYRPCISDIHAHLLFITYINFAHFTQTSLVLGHTSVCIAIIAPMPVGIVARLSVNVHTWRPTWCYTQEKSLLHARCVVRLIFCPKSIKDENSCQAVRLCHNTSQQYRTPSLRHSNSISILDLQQNL